ERLRVRGRAGVDRAPQSPVGVRPLDRRRVGALDRRHALHHAEPGHGGADRRGLGRGPGRRRRGGRRRRSGVRAVGRAVRRGARQVPVPDRPPAAGTEPRARGRREPRRRQADPRDPRRRPAAGRGALLLLRGVGGQAPLRRGGPRAAADRRLRRDHPVELPAPDGGLEDRAGPGVRQHPRPEARRDDAPHEPPAGRDLRGGRAARGRAQHRDGGGRHGGDAGPPSGRAEGRLHRLHRGRCPHRRGARRARHAADARAGRQGRERGVRRRGARPGGRGHRQRHLLQPGPRLLRRLAPARRGVGGRAARREARAPHPAAPRRRPARQEHRRRGDQLRRAAGPDPGARRCGDRRGRNAAPARLSAPGARLLVPAHVLHRRLARPSHRARGDLRAGAVRDDVPHAGRGGRAGQQHPLRPLRRRVDRQGRQGVPDGLAAEGGRRLGQHLQQLRPDRPVRR
ncbi:MAG: Aldehyde dehydrogenase, partial [uncultured Thermoleophilia bacterium]